VARTVIFKEMNGLFASLIRHEYFADVRMLYRVICGCLSAAISANYPLQHPHIRRSAFYWWKNVYIMCLLVASSAGEASQGISHDKGMLPQERREIV